MADPVKLYLAQTRAAKSSEVWHMVTPWFGSLEEAEAYLALVVPAIGVEARVLALTPEVVLEPAPAPTVTSLTPDTAVVGGPDVTLQVGGTGFVADSKVVWGGVAEPTVYVSATELTTVVKPSTASGPGTVQVGVAGAAETLPFTFTAA